MARQYRHHTPCPTCKSILSARTERNPSGIPERILYCVKCGDIAISNVPSQDQQIVKGLPHKRVRTPIRTSISTASKTLSSTLIKEKSYYERQGVVTKSYIGPVPIGIPSANTIVKAMLYAIGMGVTTTVGVVGVLILWMSYIAAFSGVIGWLFTGEGELLIMGITGLAIGVAIVGITFPFWLMAQKVSGRKQ